ncbi:MAG: sensor histidine kinase [Planctomycetota bacterium]
MDRSDPSLQRELTVLLVDDDSSMLILLETLLRRRSKLQSRSVGDAESAWQELERKGIDIVIADIGLPGIDGCELVRRMKAHPDYRLIPVVLITGQMAEDAIDAVFAAGADDFLTKPIHGRELHARLIAASRLRRLHLELRGKNRELVQSLEQLEETQQHMVHLQKMEAIGALAAGIAHEINTPTQYVGDNLRFLKDAFADLAEVDAAVEGLAAAAGGAGDVAPALAGLTAAREEADTEFLAEEIPQALEQALEGVDRVASIVQAMRDFSYHGTAEKRACDLEAIITSTSTLARNEYKYVADLEVDIAPDLPPLVCDESAIKQALLNLIVNAAHAIEERQKGEGDDGRGQIRIAASNDGTDIFLSVADTGVGISPEVKRRIFEPFFTTKEAGKGTGQGLAILHNVIVGSHRGSIEVESRRGEGTVFTLRIPGGDAPVTDPGSTGMLPVQGV